LLPVESHAQTSHDGEAPIVVGVGHADYLGELELSEAVVEPGGGRLGGVAIAPVLERQAPGHLDVIWHGGLVVQPAHPQEAPVRTALHRQQTHPFARIDVVRPSGDVVGILAAHRLAAEVSEDLRLGVQRRVVRQIVESERP